jgi:aminocarboxymuconate-semialdehyde decarboxylase
LGRTARDSGRTAAHRGSPLVTARVIPCARVLEFWSPARAPRADVLEGTMSTRREFVEETATGVAGIAFVGCNLAAATPAQAQTRRREVVVNGRRVKTVDVHAHCAVPEAMALMGRKVDPQTLLMTRPTDRIQAMDEQGIDVEALSINPYWYKADRDVARELIRVQNEKLAEACAANPDRFVAFASVALQHPELAAEQLEDGVKKYGLRGAGIGGSVNGQDLSDPKFHPFWAKAEQLGVLIFIHPQGDGAASDLQSRLKGSGGLDNAIGNPLETTIALSHLIFEGTLDHFPGLKICAAHGGGYLPSYADRSDAICVTFPNRCTTPLKKKPTEYLRQLYFDSLVFTPEALRHLVAQTGSGQIVMGTDYPYPWTKTSVDHILGTPGLSDAERVAMLGGTAAKLLGIKG